MQFSITQQHNLIRVGELTGQQKLTTPLIVQPATVLTILTGQELKSTGSQATYVDALATHLNMNLRQTNFKQLLNWPGALFTSSGSELAYSLAKPRGRKKDGVNFHAPHDQRLIHFTPEESLQIQKQLGADYGEAMSRAENYYAPVDDLTAATEQTITWYQQLTPSSNTFAPVVGGGLKKLRRTSIDGLGTNVLGYSIQQLDQTDNAEETGRILNHILPLLSAQLPRLAKVGPYWDQIQVAIHQGVDIIESDLALVMTNRQYVLTSDGQWIALHKLAHSDRTILLTPDCQCQTCQQGYRCDQLAFLLKHQTPLGQRLLLIHNLYQLNQQILAVRDSICHQLDSE